MTPITPREIKRFKRVYDAIHFWVTRISCAGFYRKPSMYEIGFIARLSIVSKAERDYALNIYLKEVS